MKVVNYIPDDDDDDDDDDEAFKMLRPGQLPAARRCQKQVLLLVIAAEGDDGASRGNDVTTSS